MSDSNQDDPDISETDAVETDDKGRPRATMEALQKGGTKDIRKLTKPAADSDED